MEIKEIDTTSKHIKQLAKDLRPEDERKLKIRLEQQMFKKHC